MRVRNRSDRKDGITPKPVAVANTKITEYAIRSKVFVALTNAMETGTEIIIATTERIVNIFIRPIFD